MDYCLSCDEQLLMQLTWQNVVYLKKRPKLCRICASELKQIPEKRCKTCSRQTSMQKCEDCKRWRSMYGGNDPLLKNVSVYLYNEWIKEMITKWKYRGDYVVGEIFQEKFLAYFNEAFAHVKNEALIVPIPLSDERLFERGFNQAQMLASFLLEDSEQLLTRVHSEKQAKKSRIERMTSINPFEVKERVKKPIILVDDIYTTGRTVRHAAQTLKESGCPAVYSYTLIRG